MELKNEKNENLVNGLNNKGVKKESKKEKLKRIRAERKIALKEGGLAAFTKLDELLAKREVKEEELAKLQKQLAEIDGNINDFEKAQKEKENKEKLKLINNLSVDELKNLLGGASNNGEFN